MDFIYNNNKYTLSNILHKINEVDIFNFNYYNES